MDLVDIATIKKLCQLYNIRPSKKYGQNFLVDERMPKKMCEAAQLTANDVVVEVGPGLGMLTREIAKRVKKVVAVEVDVKMFAAAKEILAPYRNVEVLHEDILKIPNQHLIEFFQNLHAPTPPNLPSRKTTWSPRDFTSGRGGNESISPPRTLLRGGVRGGSINYKVVASLPYSITSAALRKFTEGIPRPSLCVFMVQKEVAQRVCAKSGEMSVLSVAVQYYGVPEIVTTVKRGAFWPVPEVDSAILKIEIFGGRTSDPTEVRPPDFEKRFFQIIRIGFSSRRKQLQNNLMAGLHLPREKVVAVLKQAGFNPQIRAQELSVGEWVKLAEVISNIQLSISNKNQNV